MTNEMNLETANAVLLYARIAKAKNGMERAVINYATPAGDWLLERGLIKVGTTNASARAWSRWASSSAYVTPAGKHWISEVGGLHTAMTFLAAHLRALTAANPVSP